MTKSVAQLCSDNEISVAELVAQSGLDESRITAIVEGRWTPSPAERQRIAGVFSVSPADITWGHKTPIQHIWGHGPS